MFSTQVILIALNVVAFCLLWWRGRLLDRLAVVLLVLGTAGSFAFGGVIWKGAYVGVFLVDALCFVGLWILAERANRWWIVLTAGFQLIGTLAHFAPFLAHERLAWAQVTLMWAIWVLVGLTAFFGVWEVEADRRFALEGRHGSKLVVGGGAGAAAAME
ncbi:hypothetical protein [Brevundimonas naejangsanensis]|uniref:hypothetical protein n=1 Tax=Brevundimonas naejangsanensis TaxID=588932 RepID=UPI001F09AC16|nr:hypothetical protein [Brevundimonas naejangsanensis]